MLEYFSFKKVKKHRDDKAAEKQKGSEEKDKESSKTSTSKPFDPDAAITPSSPIIISKPVDQDQISVEGATPVLDHEDEKFLEHLASGNASFISDDNDEGPPPPLPPRVKTPVIEIDSDDASSILSTNKKEDKKAVEEGKSADSDVKKGKGKEKEKGGEGKEKDKSKRFSFVTNLSRNISLRRKPAATASPSTSKPDLHPDPDHLAVPPTAAEAEAEREHTEMARVLDDLDLSARNNRVFSLSAESADMVRRFTQVLRDLVNGVPTAYGDLIGLLDDRDGALARGYEKLPKSLKKLVAQLPEKLTSTLAPELLAVAAEAQGLEAAEASTAAAGAGKAGLTEAAKKFFAPGNLHDLVTRPGALASLLRGIVNALKARFPAFIGTNVLWSLAVFLLLSMLWYCYKRGREVRLEREASEALTAEGEKNPDDDDDDETIDGHARIEELPDDPMLAGPGPSSTAPAGVAPASDTPEVGKVHDAV